VSSPDHWEHFPHGADIGVRGIARTRDAAFAQAAVALTAVVVDPSTIRDTLRTTFSCEAPDDSLLLVDWLNELVYDMATTGRVYGRFDVTIRDSSGGRMLDAVATGEPLDQRRHQPAIEVKGATHTELHVGPRSDGQWVAECVVDV